MHITHTNRSLLNRTEALLNEACPPPTNLKQKVFLVYYKKTLTKLVSLLKKETSDHLIQNLKDFLSANWNLINKSSLSYTALPTNELTLVLCDVAQYIKANSKEQPCVLKLLMPTLTIESIKEEFPSLDTLDVQHVLKTHILGQNGNYLIPVHQFITLQNSPPQDWFNRYYDYTNHQPEMVRINQEEYERLRRHSPETLALYNAHKQYELCIKQNDSLLAHLQLLSRCLYFNSVKGVGKEDNAGNDVYDAIIKFNEYYSKLDKNTTDKIPKTVKDEIELLLNLSSNKEVNINATANLNTCIATRRDALMNAMKPLEDSLAPLGLTAQNKAILIAEKKKQVTECQRALNVALQQNKYRGQDSLSLTRAVMENLAIPCTINSMDDVRELIKLSATELCDLCQDKSLQEQLVHQFTDIVTLILFIHETPIEQLTVILTLYGEALGQKLIKRPEHISALLITMDREYSERICSLLKNHLLTIIKSFHILQDVLHCLSSEQCNALCITIKEQLLTFIKSPDTLHNALIDLPPEQSMSVCMAIKEQIPTFIKNVDHFVDVVLFLTPRKSSCVYVAIKEYIPSLIKTAFDFECILEHLSPEQRSEVYTTIKDRILILIKNAQDLKSFLEYLSPEQRSEVYITIKDQILTLTKTAYDFNCFLKYLSPEERSEVYITIKENVPKLIISAHNLMFVLEHLSPEQRSEVYITQTTQIMTSIKNVQDFNFVLRYLSPEQCSAVCMIIKERNPAILSPYQFKSMLEYLSPEQCNSVYKVIKENIPNLIKNGYDFIEILKCLSPEQCSDLYLAIKDRVPTLIESSYNFIEILRCLAPKQRSDLYLRMKSQVPKLIESSYDFIETLKCLSPEQRSDLYLRMKNQVPKLIKSSYNFIGILKCLSLEERNEMCMAIKEQILGFIDNNPIAFIILLKDLSPDQCSSICIAIKEQVLTFIKNDKDQVLASLSPEQRTAMCVSIKHLHKLITIEERNHFVHTYFPDLIQKRKIQHHFFHCLAQDIKVKSIEFKNNGFITAHCAAEHLFNKLEQVSIKYFGSDTTKPTIDYPQFKSACEAAIEDASELNNHRGWKEFFAQLVLSIVSLGIIPAVLAVVSKISTGNWRYCLFDTKSTETTNEIRAVVNEFNR